MAEIGGVVAGKVVDSLFVVAKKEISYMWNCKKNVEKFRNEVGKLKDMRGRIQQQIAIAESNGDHLIHGVQEWVKTADAQILEAEEFLKQEANAKKKCCCKVGLCGNWGTLHRFGKGAIEKAPTLLEHQELGVAYEHCVYVDTPAPTQLDVYQNMNLDDIVTQNSALEDIIKSLEDESIQIIGIYGLGGVGKTTLAKEVVSKVKNTLFADVAFTTVSQTVNADKIQKDLESATKRIVKGDKILIILDDVWEKLNLEELCIPCGSNYKNCKILLTSRSEKVCQKMKAQIKICVNSLPIKESWILFKRVVGEQVVTDASLKPVALKVVEECGGLPLLIQAVANALKDESIKSWKWALNQLQKHAPLDIDEEIRKSFTHLKLSYDYLKSEEAKSCFLLCSMFPEDEEILLEDLLRYGVGLGKFDDLDSMEDARGRVQNAVNILTSSALLLNTQREAHTKMHDVVRDVALLIASQGNNKFLVKARQGLTEWLPRATSLESYAGISLMYNHIINLPDYEVYLPHLQFFTICGNHDLSMISDEFIGCMKEVKVLDISWNNISSLPQSFQLLANLRTLDLSWNSSLCQISTLGELKKLEILILSRTGIAEIPKEIGQLLNLRVLEVKGCKHLFRITPGVIAALSRLEELCIEFKLNFNGASDCIVEVMRLSKLTYLDLTVPSIDDIPARGFNSEKLKGFVIQIEEYRPEFVHMSRSDRYLIVSSDQRHLVIPLVKWLKELIEVSRPHVILNGIENLNNMMPTLCDEGFNKLQYIKLKMCSNVSCLVDDDGTRCDGVEGKTDEKYFMELKHLELLILYELKVIWKCRDEYVSLTNLVTLKIWECDKLERVLTVSVAQGLVKLKKLEIAGCSGLEEVIYGGGGDDESGNVIVFPSLSNISLKSLDSLKSFINYSAGGGGNCSIKYPSLVDVKLIRCRNMKKWGPGTHETPNLKFLNSYMPIFLDGPSHINEAVEKLWRKQEQQDDVAAADE